ncbi:MAG TPA: ABC transporter permease, partial [Trueperaceae bacterium]
MNDKRAITPWLLSLPALILLAVLFMLPVLRLMVLSLFIETPDGYRFTLHNYVVFFTDPYTLKQLWVTCKISFITTFISLVLAFPVALYMRQLPPRTRGLLAFLVLSPLLTSVVVRTLAWVYLLGSKGVLNTFLGQLGLPPVQLIYNESGVVIGLVHVLFGYMILSLMTSVLKIDDNLLYAAANLGASKLVIFWKIILPLSLPGILAGFVLVFTMSASTYATSAMLGGSRTRLLAPEVYNLAVNRLAWDEASTAATILFVMIAVVVV